MKEKNISLPGSSRYADAVTSVTLSPGAPGEVYLARYLKTQTGRLDAVGHLARDVARDPRFPKRTTLSDYVMHLRLNGATELAIAALELAFEEAGQNPKLVASRKAVKSPLEITIEEYFMDRVKAMGGREMKMGMNGWPDRLVVIKGRTGFLELKRPGERPRPLQVRRIGQLCAAGALAGWADTREGVDWFLQELTK